MSNYRQLHTHMWKDVWFLDLATDEKLLFVYLFSNERASICGLYELSLRVICFETALTEKRAVAVMKKFQDAGKVFYEDGLVWVVNLRKYNENTSPKVRTKINADLALVPDCKLKRRYLDHYSTGNTVSGTPDTISETVSEQEQEQEIEQEAGAGAPPSDKLKAKSMADLPPQVKVYLDHGGKFPSGALTDGTPRSERARAFICENVKDTPDSLSLWGRVVAAYQMQWSPKSYTVMVNDYYLRGRVPGEPVAADNGHAVRPATKFIDYS